MKRSILCVIAVVCIGAVAPVPQSLIVPPSGWVRENHPSEPRTEIVFVADGRRVYYARYSYPVSLPPLAKARAAIASLCLHGRIVSNVVPAPPVKFVAPSGWMQSNPATFGEPMWPGTIAMYLRPHDSASIVPMKEPSPGDPGSSDDANAQSAEDAEKSHVTSYERQTTQLEQLCGHAAAFFAYRATYGNRKIDAEDILLLGPTMYVASYLRAAGSPEDPSARVSLDALCPPVTDATPPSNSSSQRIPVSLPSPMSSSSPTVIQPTPSAR